MLLLSLRALSDSAELPHTLTVGDIGLERKQVCSQRGYYVQCVG